MVFKYYVLFYLLLVQPFFSFCWFDAIFWKIVELKTISSVNWSNYSYATERFAQSGCKILVLDEWYTWDFCSLEKIWHLLHSVENWGVLVCSQWHVSLCPAAAAQLSSSSHKWCFVAPSIYFITRAPDILGSVLIFGESWDAAMEGGG